ncbi:hypothetical protein ACGRHY_27220 [Streptomyces sp. HK10]|uniref:hypothetical protein n=1 Tax=Streptomyces sp. HK10 TaxID=3373255 RepID=UPI0037483B8A
MLWDKDLATQQKTAAGKDQPRETSQPKGWGEILRERPWARAAARLERGMLPAIGEVIQLALPRGGTAKEKAEHLAMAVLVAAAAGSAIVTTQELGMPLLVGFLLWRAWVRGAPQRPSPEAEEAVEEASADNGSPPGDHDGAGEQHRNEPVLDGETWLRRHIEYSVARNHALGFKGMHLVEILTTAQADHDWLIGWDVAQLRKECQRLGIPVNNGINLRGKNTIGIRYDELSEHLGRSPRLPPELVPDRTPSRLSEITAPTLRKTLTEPDR